MDESPLYSFTSHISGKNATVSIFRDRIEWVKPRGISGGKITAGIMTGGLSVLATGVKNGKTGTEMVLVKSISSVTTKRDGMLNTIVSVITTGNTIDFRVSHNEAQVVKTTLTQLMLGTHPTQAAAPAVAPPPPPATPPAPPAPVAAAPAQPDIASQLHQLAGLRDAGVITADEFDAKKTEMLARL